MKIQSSLCYMYIVYKVIWKLNQVSATSINNIKIVISCRTLYRHIPLSDILVPLSVLTMTLPLWCYISGCVVVGAGPVTEGEWVEGDERDAPPDGA